MVSIIKIVKPIFWDEHDPPVMVGEWDGKHGLGPWGLSCKLSNNYPMGGPKDSNHYSMDGLGKNFTGKTQYLMVKTMVYCKFSLNQSVWNYGLWYLLLY